MKSPSHDRLLRRRGLGRDDRNQSTLFFILWPSGILKANGFVVHARVVGTGVDEFDIVGSGA